MWGVVGGDEVDGPAGQSLDERVHVGAVAQRGVDLGVGVVGVGGERVERAVRADA